MNQNENELLMLISAQMNTEDLYLLALKRLRDESSEAPKKRVRQGNKKNFRHLGEEALQRRDYFREDPAEGDATFRRRFRISRYLYAKIKEDILRHDNYFTQRRDRAGKLGYSTNQKMTAALRMLAYAVPDDFMAEYLRVKEVVALQSMKKFCRAIIELYKTSRGFPGMLGSLDCMHWEWKNCPKVHHGSYKGKEKKPTIALEAVASYDLWIWHAFFGATGSLNDLNILARSPLFDQLVDGSAPSSSFEVNVHRYDMGYYLVDGIYPEYSTFMKIIPSPQKRRHQIFAAKQEAARKDVERAFGVLQARFNILKDPVCLWHTKSLQDVMMACIILHNMIVEDQQEDDVGFDERALEENNISSYADVHKKLRDRSVYQQLQNDLVDHLFKIYSNQPI